jgi:hypothetical protein
MQLVVGAHGKLVDAWQGVEGIIICRRRLWGHPQSWLGGQQPRLPPWTSARAQREAQPGVAKCTRQQRAAGQSAAQGSTHVGAQHTDPRCPRGRQAPRQPPTSGRAPCPCGEA